jgi:pre-rRNA-processing protein IPI3
MMTTILFPSPVTTMVIDPAERAIYVGTSASVILQFNLIQQIGGKYESVGGDPSHPLSSANSIQYDFRGHTSDITAMDLSFDATLLVSGDKSGELFVWDIASRQVLRKIKGHNGISFSSYLILGPVSNVLIFLKPDDITSIESIQQFKRLQNERGRMNHDIWMTIPDQEDISIVDDAEIARNGIEVLVQEGSESSMKSKVMELQDELQKVYGAYGDLKGLHEKLWKKYVDEKMQTE